MFSSLTSTPKIAPTGKKNTPKGSKSEKRLKIWPNLKQKDRAVLPKLELIVYISRFKNVFEPDLDPKNSPNGLKEITPKDSKSEKRPKILLNLKQKDRAVLPKQILIVYISRFQKCF